MPLDANLPSLSTAVNRLWLPRVSLSACVRGVMGRDTRGVLLNEAQRLSYFPASPLCTLSWRFEGEVESVPFGEPQAQGMHMPGRFVFGGPYRGPSLWRNPGPAHSMMLLLLPDALHRLIGLEADQWVDRFADAAQVLPPDWIAMCEAVQAAADDDIRIQLIEDFLDPRWQAVRPQMALAGHRYQDWAQGLALRAATSHPGRSLRQMERRIKQWAGQSMRELRGIARAEQAFLEVAASPRPDWAEVAMSGGYADQSHLCRETRRVTGFSPAELYRLVAENESFWAYRLWA